jgi:signal transduction histidine kinase
VKNNVTVPTPDRAPSRRKPLARRLPFAVFGRRTAIRAQPDPGFPDRGTGKAGGRFGSRRNGRFGRSDFEMNRFSRLIVSGFARMRDPLLVVDAGGAILRANAAAREVLDFEDGGNIRDARWADRRIHFDGHALLALVGGPEDVFGHRLADADGNDADAVIDVIALAGEGPNARTKLIHVKDYSGYHHYEHWKDELVSMAAHEIKNPLSAMRASMTTLVAQAGAAMPQGQQNLLAVSIRSIDRLTRLLDNLLDVSRIRSGSYTPEPSRVDLRDFASEIVGAFRTLFNVRRQSLRFSVAEDLREAYVDGPKLEQILINLLNNALKFTPEGGEIELSVEKAGIEVLPDDSRILPWEELGAPVFVRFTVRDTGLGMTGETLAHLFTRYHRGGAGGSGAGSHLGMSIAKKLSEVQNGFLVIESELGVGTKVSVAVPADESTFTFFSRMRSIDRVVPRLFDARRGLSLAAVRKDPAAPWRDVFDSWPVRPVVDPAVEDEKSGEFFAWTLGGRVAIAVCADTEAAGEARRFLESARRTAGGKRPNEDRSAITTRRLSAREPRSSALLSLALKPAPGRGRAAPARAKRAGAGSEVPADSISRSGE